MLLNTLAYYFSQPANAALLLSSWALAIIVFVAWKKTNKAVWAYSHIAFLTFPLIFFAFNLSCQLPLIEGVMQWCSVSLTKLAIYLIPPSILFAVLLGYFLMPKLCSRKAKKISIQRLDKLAQSAKQKVQYYVLDRAEPIAYSIKNSIFISAGMFDILNEKEIDAVALHELGHVKDRASFDKLSTRIMKVLSPLAYFSSITSAQEKRADDFAVKMQGTSKYLESAKIKASLFDKLK